MLKITTSLDAHNLIIGLSSTLYGLFSASIYLLLRELNIKPVMLMTIFILFQVSALRIGWDLLKDILALTFTFIINYLIIKDRKSILNKSKIINFSLIGLLLMISIFTDTMISFLLIISLLIYFLINKERKYIIFLTILITLIISFMVLNGNINGNPIIKNMNKLFDDDIKKNLTYSPINLGILFIVINYSSLPFFIYVLKYLKDLLLSIQLGITLIGSFTWLILPYSSILLPDRWIILSGIFMSIFSSYGLVRFSQKFDNKQRNRILLSFTSLFIFIGLLYITIPIDSAFSVYNIFSNYIYTFVPITMQFNSIDIADNRDLLQALDWLNNNTSANSIIYGDLHLRGWMETLLKDNRIFKFNDLNFSKNGFHVIMANNINLTNYNVKLIFSQGPFKILKK
ncbi:MAG TPA: hypothetical protein VJ697_09545 [Nitrososphaeraceae archaeon]|nr:hypothetical protein [Nitrososphaeraceae archaeon]